MPIRAPAKLNARRRSGIGLSPTPSIHRFAAGHGDHRHRRLDREEPLDLLVLTLLQQISGGRALPAFPLVGVVVGIAIRGVAGDGPCGAIDDELAADAWVG